MKKTSSIICVPVLIIIIISGAWLAIDRFFPKAEALEVPHYDGVIAVSLSDNKGNAADIDKTVFEGILHCISGATPTRQMSVNDYPGAEAYYVIRVETDERQYCYFVYEDSSRIYIESPYEGIYKAGAELLDAISECYKD